jgi:Domain of unknown function (DUF4386)
LIAGGCFQTNFSNAITKGHPMRAAQASTANSETSAHRSVSLLALLQVGLFMVPLLVLGQAIGWPASLRLPPEEALPLVAANLNAVLIGYWAYLLVSVALIPLAFAVRHWLAADRADYWLDAATFMGAAAGVLKTLGIVRWLSAMPTLAAAYVDPLTDPARKAMIEVSYLTLNGYAGAVGELLGVQLMSGLWIAAIAVLLVRRGLTMTGLLGGLAAVLFLATCLRTFWPELGALQAVSAPLGLVWTLFLAFAAWRNAAVAR